jgi:hypothetical protein
LTTWGNYQQRQKESLTPVRRSHCHLLCFASGRASGVQHDLARHFDAPARAIGCNTSRLTLRIASASAFVCRENPYTRVGKNPTMAVRSVNRMWASMLRVEGRSR